MTGRNDSVSAAGISERQLLRNVSGFELRTRLAVCLFIV
jgi:hypothetical protein